MIVARVSEIQALMEDRGMRDEDLASAAGVAINTVRNMMAGRPVSGATVSGVIKAFGQSFDHLFDVDGAQPAPQAATR